MKTVYVFALIASCFPAFTLNAQDNFHKVVGESQTYLNSINSTVDSGFIAVGITNDFGIWPDWDVYLVKLDKNGEIMWSKTYGDTLENQGKAVQQTSDGGYIITGYSNRTIAGDYDIHLIKTDSNGDLEWSKTYGGPLTQWGLDVKQTSDDGYIITGDYLFKVDETGNIEWDKAFGGTFYSVQETLDSGYVTVGNKLIGSTFDILFVKTNGNGDTLWTRTYGGGDYEWGTSVSLTSDSGFIIAGYTISFGAGSQDVYLIRTDDLGHIIWSKTYGGSSSDRAYSVVQTVDGGFLVSGDTESFGAGNGDIYLIKTDLNGDVLWSKTIGGPSYEQGYQVEEIANDNIVIVGGFSSFGVGESSSIIKVGPDGVLECNQLSANTSVGLPSTIEGSGTSVSSGLITNNINLSFISQITGDTLICSTVGMTESEKPSSIRVYPNPLTDIAIIEFESANADKYILDLHSSKGQRVMHINNIIDGHVEIRRGNLASGLYFFQLRTDGQIIATGKMIIE